MTHLSLIVNGMSCAVCEQRISAVLTRLHGVSHVHADHHAGTVVVDYDLAAVDATAIARQLDDAGYEPAEGTHR